MKSQIPRRLFAICFIFLIVLSGCLMNNNVSQKPASEKTKTASQQEEFENYLMKVFRETVTEDGINLHYTLKEPEKYQIKNQKSTLGMIKKEQIINEEKNMQKELNIIKKFEYKKLSKQQQHTYDVLSEYFINQKNLSKYSYYQEILSPVSGVQVQIPVTFGEYRLESGEDIESYLRLISQIREYFRSVISYEKERIKKGLFMSDESVDLIVGQIEEFTKRKENNILIESFQSRLDNIEELTENQKKKYKKSNRNIVIKQIIPAYEMLAEQLKIWKNNGKNKGGMAFFQSGKNYYRLLVKKKTGSSKSIPEMISLTEKNIEECILQTSDLCRKFPEIYEEYNNLNIKPYTGSNPENIINQLKKKTKKYYPKAPKVNCKIKYVHSSMEESASPAFYMIPAIDSYKENVIYINRSQVKEYVQLYSTLAHEGYPGHMYQNIYYASKKDDPVRYILDYPGYTEGWATYVEGWSYGTIEAGKNSIPLSRLNVAGMEFNLALCSRIDIGIHYEGWSRQETLKYLQTYGISKNAGNHIFAMIVCEPANYLSYYIGYKEFMELRSYYKKRAGKKYNLKTFHKIILDAGPCSFNILKKRIDENL